MAAMSGLITRVAHTVVVVTLAGVLIPRVAGAQEAAPPQGEGFFPEPQILARAIDVATRTMGDGGGNSNGFFPEFTNMITGAGWISAGPGYRRWFGGDRVVAEGSAAVSWRSYKMARARVEVTNLVRSRLAVGSEVKWQDYTQNTYFGLGADSNETARSEYRLKALDAIGYANVRPVKWVTIGGRAGWLQSPELLDPSGRFGRGYPSTATVFPDDPVFAREQQPDYLHGELSVTADTRDHRKHPHGGSLYRAAWSWFSDRDGGPFSFQRVDAEGAHFVSTGDQRVTLAMRGWLVTSHTAAEHEIPFYLMPSLGGSNTLRSFTSYRFHDRNLVVANVELRLAVLAHIDGVLFADAGNVAARAGDLNFDHRSFGVGLRLHSHGTTLGRLDIARGPEGWRLLFSTSDPLHSSRLSRRVAPIPFVP
jgi:outer membrane protein assembly factor BamA